MAGELGLTQEQIDILNLFNINQDGDLEISTNLVVEGNITAYGVGEGTLINYEMLTN